jgi:uncharacterized protein YacL
VRFDKANVFISYMARALVPMLGAALGYYFYSRGWQGIVYGGIAGGVVVAFEIFFEQVPLDTMIAGLLGIVLGLVAAKLIDWTIFQMDSPLFYSLSQRYNLPVKVVLGYLGFMIFVRKKEELELLDRDLILKGGRRKGSDIKLLDTSALIDGRIADVCETKFLSGVFVIPQFVLKELQSVADSGDSQKRAAGRRGLEILARLQENSDIPVKIFEKDYPRLTEVDAKLTELARELHAKIVTTDFNLNKAAAVQGVAVLNLNDLANAVKPVVLPGQSMSIFVAKEGKESDQGVGYLDDGTMVVVEDGRRLIGRRVELSVASILQTSAGRMIFTRPKDRPDRTPERHADSNDHSNERRHNR